MTEAPVLPETLSAPVVRTRLHAETANALTHGTGFVLSLVGFYFLLAWTEPMHDDRTQLACAVFGAALIALYAASTLLHSSRTHRRRAVYELLDHCAIYVLIAGTYTPLFLVPMAGALGTLVLRTIWCLALVGILFKTICGCNRYPAWSVASYLVTGWLPVFVLKQMLEHMSVPCIVWLVLGGVMYTIGVPFYLNRRMTYAHAVWHLFVMAGSACHFRAVMYALGIPIS